MEQLRSSTLVQTYRFDCDRFLSFHVTEEGAERSELNLSVLQRIFGRTLIGVAERRWNQSCYRALIDASSPDEIDYLREYEVDELVGIAQCVNLANLLNRLRRKEPPRFIIKPAVIAPVDLVEGLADTYEAYQLEPESIVFDVLWIRPLEKGTYSVSIIDIRLAENPSLAHRMELSLQALALRRVLEANDLAGRYSVSEHGYIWPGSHEPDRFASLIKNYQSAADPIGEALTETLVPVRTETYSRHVLDLLTCRLPSVLKAGFENSRWHLGTRCLGCDFFPICLGEARKTDDLSRIPFLSRSQADVLRNNGIKRVSRLSELEKRDDSALSEIFRSDYRLQIDEKRIRARIKAFASDAPVPVAQGRTVSMPARDDLRICLTTGCDPSTGISIGFGCSMDSWEPSVYLVESSEGMSLASERSAYLLFATTLARWVKQTNGVGEIRFYVWDDKTLAHLRRVVRRYYDDSALDKKANPLNLLFPPEGILDEPHVLEYQPVTVVAKELESLVGLPLDVSYSLYESANCYARVNHDLTFGMGMGFAKPYSEEIPFEWAIELWDPKRYAMVASRMGFVQERRTKEELLDRIEGAFTEQLNALRYLVYAMQKAHQEQLRAGREIERRDVKHMETTSPLGELLKFERLNIAAQAAENRRIRSMGVDERETRFHSIRGLRIQTPADAASVLKDYREDHPEIDTGEFHVFDCSPDSTESRIKEGEFTLVLTNEEGRLDLDAPWYRHFGLDFEAGAALLSGYDKSLKGYENANLGKFLQVELIRLGNKDGIPHVIVRFPKAEILDLVLREGIITFYKPLVIDPIFIDFTGDRMEDILRTIESDPSSTAYRFLLEPKMLESPVKPAEPESVYKHVDSYLTHSFNENQKEFFLRTFEQRISMLWGPPGTGKTTVLAGTIFGWVESFRKAEKPLHVCIGAVTYTAIETLLDALVELRRARMEIHPDEPIDILRLRSPAAKESVNPLITDITDVSQVAGRLEDPANRVVIVGSTWQQIGKLAVGDGGAFDLLVLDEASQIPVAAAAAYFLHLKEDGHLALAGDDHQLGPIRGYRVEDTKRGLFDCIYTYMKDTHGIDPFLLEMNYRTNREISAWPSSRFYEEKFDAHDPKRRLKFKQPIREKPADWPKNLPWSDEYLKLLDPDDPVVVITYDHPGYTLSNAFEAEVVAALTVLYKRQLEVQDDPVDLKRFWEDQLGIVTPHRAQMAAIRNTLFDEALFPRKPEPVVDTVERFQGRERDCIISSYVVSDKDFVRSEEEFILDHRRFNVTLTRARKKFIMLVSSAIVRHLSEKSALSEEAAHLQLFVEEYCDTEIRSVLLPFREGDRPASIRCSVRVKRFR
ncbi:MAG: AAA family ATPase [Spirochaetales bacterium]|nr:AAA family ATPase [Spirochaetales bacterium]